MFSGSFACLYAQTTDSLWHININELTIEQSRDIFFREDKKILQADSAQISHHINSNVGEILAAIAPVYINSYGGNGSVSGILLRGAGSSQTSVNWNGFPLNSITLGSADLSLFPVSFFDEISLTYSAAGSLHGSGTFGGSVNLNQHPRWNNKFELSFAPEYGSFSDKRLSLIGKAGTSKIQYHAFVSHQQSLNNFVYSDRYKYGNPREVTENNSFSNTTIIQNVYLKLPSGNILEAGVWYQSKMKEIPAIMGSYLPGNAVQRDSTLKMFIKWTKLFRNSSLSLKSAWFNDHMLYRDKFSALDDDYSIDSKIEGNKYMADASWRSYIGKYLTVDIGAGLTQHSAIVDNYGGKINEIIPVGFSGVKFRKKFTVVNFSIRKEFHSNIHLLPLISAGIRTGIIPQFLTFRMNYSDQFRIPTFNDKYWRPGGSPGLLPEKGWSADAGFEFNLAESKKYSFSMDIAAFHTNIDNLIQWMPSGTGFFWAPKNTKKVFSNGIETQARYRISSTHFKIFLNAGYSFTRSTISKSYEGGENLVGMQLIYRPNHQFNFQSRFDYKRFYLAGYFNFTGKRFTTEDNNPVYAMPFFYQMNIITGYSVIYKEIKASLQFKVQNILNHQYQVVRSYPMPGRIFHVGIILNYQNQLN